MLDVAIGIIFIFLLISLICTAVNEFIESFLKLRAVDLEQGIREILDDPNGTGIVQRFWNHHLINSLFRGNYHSDKIRNVDGTSFKKKRYSRGSDLPSYIPARNFALALMDILLPANTPSPQPNNSASTTNNLSGSSGALAPANDVTTGNTAVVQPNPLSELRNAVSAMTNTRVKGALLTILDAAGDDVVKAREGLESWFNSAMDRVAGWYKRRVQQIVFVLGIILSIAMNADSIAIFKNLANDRPLRSAIVSQAEAIKDTSVSGRSAINKNVNTLLELGLPIGWGWRSDLNDNKEALPNLIAIPRGSDLGSWLLKIIGWLITGLAVSLGSPFWFDSLNKIMVIRSTVKPHEKSPEEPSQDR